MLVLLRIFSYKYQFNNINQDEKKPYNIEV